jgi:hypothetical protein
MVARSWRSQTQRPPKGEITVPRLLRAAGFSVSVGQIGENVTTRGIDLLGLPSGTRRARVPAHLGADRLRQIISEINAALGFTDASTVSIDQNRRMLE